MRGIRVEYKHLIDLSQTTRKQALSPQPRRRPLAAILETIAIV
jgi:hypothetical protein